MRKIFKIILILFFCFIGLNVIDLAIDSINSSSDISNQNKITIYDSESEIIYEQINLHEASYVKLEDINDITKMVFVEIEDRRFYSHIGIDPITTTKAFFQNLGNDYKVGGSTITQQYAKNLYLTNDKTYIRKIKEAYYSIRLEQLYSKDEILEGYLNTIYFNNGIYGINDASKYYFNKSPNELTLKETTSLVTIIKSPTNYCLVNNFENNNERTLTLLKTLYQRDCITEKEYHEAINQDLVITKTKENKYSSSVLYFKDYVISNITNNKDELHIYTNYNTELNTYIDSLLTNVTSDVSIVVMDKEGYLVSLIGNSNYFESNYNIATMSTRMIGSTIKPMLYYEALEFGISIYDTFVSEQKDFIVDNDIISIHNYNNVYDNAPITMQYAIATSDNIYAMKTHLFIGTNKLSIFLKRFGITPINDKYTISLGTQDMSLLSLTSIYNTFLNLGNYTQPKSYTHYFKNNILISNISLKNQILNSDTCETINFLLEGTFNSSLNAANNVTGNSIASLLNKEAYAKSGLTDYDSYMIGFTNKYTIGIWTGHSNNDNIFTYDEKKLPKELFYKIVNKL